MKIMIFSLQDTVFDLAYLFRRVDICCGLRVLADVHDEIEKESSSSSSSSSSRYLAHHSHVGYGLNYETVSSLYGLHHFALLCQWLL